MPGLVGPDGVTPLAVPPAPENTEPPSPQPPQRVITAFLVFQTPNGQWLSSADLATPIQPVRAPQPDDLISGAENIKQQVIARRTADLTAVKTVQTQMAMAQQMRSQQLTPDEAAALAAAQRRG